MLSFSYGTGAGKSMIYQAAGRVIPGPTLVISPLLALQRDQVEAIQEQGIGEAALINSTVGHAEVHEALEGLKAGKLEFLFLAPEQFNNEEIMQQLKREQAGPVHPRDLQARLDLSETKMMQVLIGLQEVGIIETLPTGEVIPGERAAELDEVAEEVEQLQEERRQFEQSRVEMIRGYAETYSCRREYLLNYFGEQFKGPCGYCDACEAGTATPEQEEEQPFPLNSKVTHKTWGEGLVMRYEGDKIVVLFENVGYKTLSLQVVKEKQLLEPH